MNDKPMPLFVFIAMLFIGALFDLIGFLMFTIGLVPILGTPFLFLGSFVSASFIFFSKLGFWLAGYRSASFLFTGAMALGESIPGLSAVLPGCIAFVIQSYRVSKKPQKILRGGYKEKVA
jgi:hypothetical protein